MEHITPDQVFQLSSRRWLIPILAAMANDRGSRFGVLLRRLAISRSVLSSHLDTLEQFGWIARNAGHGHPLRPEYIVTRRGAPLTHWCSELMSQRKRLGLEQPSLGRWSLPVLSELTCERKRFSALQRSLPNATPRALSLTLDRMADARLIDHHVSLYGLTPLGLEFAQPLLIKPRRLDDNLGRLPSSLDN